MTHTFSMVEETIYQAFGRAIATRRRVLGLTQADLAARVGMSRASIANIESGRQNVLLHHVFSLATALQMSKIADLLPALPRPALDVDMDLYLPDEGLSARGKAQITDLIVGALGQRGPTKVGS